MSATVTVVIPNRDGAALLPEVLDALAAQTRPADRVLVVDDGSLDASVEVARGHELGPEVVPVRDGPRGFGAAANTGIRHAPGSRFVALLNNDAIPDPTWLEALVDALDRRADFGFAASRVRFLYSPDLLESAGDAVAACGQPFRRAHRAPDGPRWEQPVEILAASAAAALYRRDLLLQLGGFDEDFFAVYEDVDLGWRAFRRGWRGLYVPAATVRHRSGATLGRGERAYYLDQRNVEWLLAKNLRGLTFLKALPGYCLHHAWGLARAAHQGRLGLYLRAKWDALRGLPGVLAKRQTELLEARTDRHQEEAALDWTWAARHARALLGGPRAVDAHEFGRPLAR